MTSAGAIHLPPRRWLDPIAEAERSLPDRGWRAPSPRASWDFIRGGFVGDVRRLVADLREYAEQLSADVLVGDTMLPGAAWTAEILAKPWASIAPTPALGFAVRAGSFGTGFAPPGVVGVFADPIIRLGLRRAMDAQYLRRALGLPPRPGNTWMQGISPYLHIWPATPNFLGAGRVRSLPPEHHATGPLISDLQRPILPEVQQWMDQDDGRPLVLVGSSTSAHLQRSAGGLQYLTTVVEALAEMPVRAVVTVGDSSRPAALTRVLGPNTALVGFVPHGAILSRAALCVHHGGWGTTGRCLAAGVPAVVIPLVNDEPFVARRLAELGWATVLTAAELSAQRVRQAVEETLANQEMRLRVRLEALSIARRDPASLACRLLVRLAETGRPVVRDGTDGGGDGN